MKTTGLLLEGTPKKVTVIAQDPHWDVDVVALVVCFFYCCKTSTAQEHVKN